MDSYKCHKCLTYSCFKVEDGYICKECNVLFTNLVKKSSKNKTFNNKKIHFNNVMKDISKQYDIDGLLSEVKTSITDNNIDKKFINQSLISNILKKNITRFKDYKMVFNILNEIENNEKKIHFSAETKNNIEILFLSFINFLYCKNKLDSISYNLILSNIFKIYDINNNFKPMVKEEKEDLWNMFVYTIANNYYNKKSEITREKYTNYKPKTVTLSLYIVEDWIDY